MLVDEHAILRNKLTLRIDRLGPLLQRLHVLRLAFRIYQRASGLNPGVHLRNRRHATPDGLAIPPPDLMMEVAGSPELSVFLHGGGLAASSIREILARNGIEMEGLGAILDFGCGCGRVLRFWKCLDAAELHGCDYNPRLAGWCARKLKFARVAINGLEPPTEYGAASFDLIYALSVFTHLTEESQAAWMKEFHRILRHGGLLLLSLHGAHYLPRLNAEERRHFLAGRLVVRYGGSLGTNLCSVFHPEGWVRRHLAQNFEVLDFIPEGARGNPRQDEGLFRRKAEGRDPATCDTASRRRRRR